MLLRMLAEIDRINQSGTEEKPVHMDDHFLFAVLLLPWAITLEEWREHRNFVNRKINYCQDPEKKRRMEAYAVDRKSVV